MATAARLCQTPDDYDAWDEFVLRHRGAHYSQLYGWLSSYEPMGFRCNVIMQREGERVIAGAAFVSFKIPVLSRRIFILPHGPLCEPSDDSSWRALMGTLDQEFRRQAAIYVQTWPPIARNDVTGLEKYREAGYVGPPLFKAHAFTSILLAIDLADKSETEILAGFRQETRHHLRKCQMTGLTLRLGRTREDLKRSYKLLQESAQYHGYEPRPYRSMEIAFDRLVTKDRACLLQAWKDDALVGTMFLLFAGRTATYCAGAIDREFSKLYPAEFMHLQALRIAKKRGLEVYDLMNWVSSGVEQFKRGFRPQECIWADPRTKIFKPMLARTLALAEDYCRPLLRGLARWRADRGNGGGTD